MEKRFMLFNFYQKSLLQDEGERERDLQNYPCTPWTRKDHQPLPPELSWPLTALLNIMVAAIGHHTADVLMLTQKFNLRQINL